MKKLILFVFVLVAGNVKGQPISCDSLPLNFQQYCQYPPEFDTISFTDSINLIVIDTTNACNIWQLGYSHKVAFDSASSFGLTTDTINPYLTNVKCSFIIKHPKTFAFVSYLFFEHKFDTDSLFDGGYLEYSCDGTDWRLVDGLEYTNNNAPIFISYYNYPLENQSLLQDSIPSFTGVSDDWQWSGLQFVWALPVMKPEENRSSFCNWENDTLYYRFIFLSDTIENYRAGWMIRNIVFAEGLLSGSLPEFSCLPLKLFPNPATEKISIELPPNSGKLSSILISDIAGNVALRATEAREIDVSTLSPGIYFVLAETDKFVLRQKLVKQ